MRALLFLALVLGGCENDVDDSQNRLLLPDSGAVDAGLSDGGGVCPTVGDWYVFDVLKVTSLAGDPMHGAIPNLNTIWAADIAMKQLNIFFEIAEADESGVVVRAVNAARLDADTEDWCVMPETTRELVFELGGRALTMTEEAGVNIYAGSESIPKICAQGVNPRHTIPIRETLLAARFSADCGRILEGHTTQAVIYGEDLRRVCSCLVPGLTAEQCGPVDPDFDSGSFDCDGCNSSQRNLHSLLASFVGGEEGLYEIGEDGRERLTISAEFSAVRAAQPPVCP